MSAEPVTSTRPQHRKERAHPDWPICVYSYWIEPVGDIPDWIWSYHDLMQTLWNGMCEAHDLFIDYKKKSEEEAGEKWPTDRKRIEFAAFREQLKNLAKSCKGVLPNSCYYEVRDKFLVAMGRYWNPNALLRHRRTASKNYELGKPRKHFGREKILIPHDMNASNVSASIVFAGRKPLTLLQRTAQQGPTRGSFESGGRNFDFRINLHRPIPEGNIKRIAIVGHYVKPFGWEWSLHLTIEEPPRVGSAKNGRMAAIDLGWRLMDEERIRIGVLVDNSDNAIELSVPLDFADSNIRRQIKHFAGRRDAVLPIHTISGMWEAQEESDLALEQCKAKLERTVPDSLPNKAAWQKSRHKGLVRLLNRLREADPESPGIKVIEDWRKQNYTMHRRWRCAYERFLRWRREIYRLLSAAIAETYDTVVLEDRLNLSEMSQDTDAPPAIKASQKYRHWASPHLFKDCLKRSMEKAGREVAEAKAAMSTATCSICGGAINTDAPLYLTCERGHRQDQDVNAARNLLLSQDFERLPGHAALTDRSQISRYVKPLSSLKSL